MSEIRRIGDQFKRAYQGEAWHGPDLKSLLWDVSAEMAALRPIEGAHSIWELVQHITAWNRAAARRMQGDPAALTAEEDWPPVSATNNAAWKRTVADLEAAHAELAAAIEALPAQRLKERAAGQPYSIYFMLHGVIQHDLYHAGQIALLKKAASGG